MYLVQNTKFIYDKIRYLNCFINCLIKFASDIYNIYHFVLIASKLKNCLAWPGRCG